MVLPSRRLAASAVPGSTILFLVTIIAVVGIVAVYNITASPSVGEGPQNQIGGGSSSHLVITNSSTYLVTTVNSTSTYTISYFNCSSLPAPVIDVSQVIVNHKVMCMDGGPPVSVGNDGRVDFMNGSVVYLHANMNNSGMMSSGLHGNDTVVIADGTRFIVNASGVLATLYPYQGKEVFANGTITTFPPCIYPATTNIEGSSSSYNGTASFSYANGLTVKFYPNGTCSATGNG